MLTNTGSNAAGYIDICGSKRGKKPKRRFLLTALGEESRVFLLLLDALTWAQPAKKKRTKKYKNSNMKM